MRRAAVAALVMLMLGGAGLGLARLAVPSAEKLWDLKLTEDYASCWLSPEGYLVVEDSTELKFVEPATGSVSSKITLQQRANLYSSPLMAGHVNVSGELFKIEDRQLVYLAGDKQDDYSFLLPIDDDGYVSYSSRDLARLDTQGRTRWNIKGARLWPGNMVDGVLFAYEGRYLLAIDDSSGKVLWHVPSEWVSYAHSGGGLAVAGRKARLLDGQGKALWEYEAREKIRSAYAWRDGTWLICRDSLYCVDNAGKLLGRVRGDRNFKACLDDGTLIVSTESRDARYNASSSGKAGEEITLTAIAPSGRRLWRWRSDVLYWTVTGSAQRAFLVGDKKLTALAAGD